MRAFRHSAELNRAVTGWEGIRPGPSPENRPRRAGIRLFENRFVERWLGTAHPIVPGLWVIPLAGFLLAWSVSDTALGIGGTAGWFALGVLLWTLLEYLLHRFLFHMAPGPGRRRKLVAFLVHGYHHEFPRDASRLVAPLAMSWSLGAVVGVLLWLAVGLARFPAVAAGVFSGYLAYDWIHFYTHHARPRTRVGRFLQRYHLAHHYRDPKTHFGISSPFWDWVFGTAERRAR